MSFRDRVYRLVRQIPKGKVATYGQIACALGAPRAARAVGTALHLNPDGVGTPCHRVVNRHGCLAPAYAFGGLGEQQARLEADGVRVTDGRVCLSEYLVDSLDEDAVD